MITVVGGGDPKPWHLTRSKCGHHCGSHTLREINRIPAGSISLIREGWAPAQAPLNADNFIRWIIWDKAAWLSRWREKEQVAVLFTRLGPLLQWRQVIWRTLGQQVFQHKVSLIEVSATRVLAETTNQRPQIEAFAGNYYRGEERQCDKWKIQKEKLKLKFSVKALIVSLPVKKRFKKYCWIAESLKSSL